LPKNWPAALLLRETDFRLEAEHAARFRPAVLEDRHPHSGVIWELSSRRVLCLDYPYPGSDHRSPALVAPA